MPQKITVPLCCRAPEEHALWAIFICLKPLCADKATTIHFSRVTNASDALAASVKSLAFWLTLQRSRAEARGAIFRRVCGGKTELVCLWGEQGPQCGCCCVQIRFSAVLSLAPRCVCVCDCVYLLYVWCGECVFVSVFIVCVGWCGECVCLCVCV